MLYSKNDDVRYTMMCKEFDEEFWKPERDDTKLFRTAYLVFYMLACKENFFSNIKGVDYYDAYAIYAATIVYVRFLKKLRNGERVKSLLNYAKSSQGFLKIMFQNEEFETLISPEQNIDTQSIKENLQTHIRTDYREGLVEDMQVALSRVGDIARDVVDDTQFDKLTKHRLYISALLTLQDSITLPRELKAQFDRKKALDDNVVLEAYNKERENPPILWNLNPTMSGVVKVVVNKIRQELSDELNDTIKEHTLPDDVIDLILADVYTEGRVREEKEEDYD